MVSLGADIAATLPFLREQANSRMTETFQFYTTALVFDPETLEDVPTETEVGVTPGRLKVTSNQGREVETGNQYPVVERLEVHIPTDTAFTVPVGTLVRCTASTADASIVGREFRVSERPQAGQTTAHRHAVEEVS